MSVEWDDDIYGFPDENDVGINTAIEALAGAMYSALSEKEGDVASGGATAVTGDEENLHRKEDESDKNGNTNKLPFKAFSYFEKRSLQFFIIKTIMKYWEGYGEWCSGHLSA